MCEIPLQNGLHVIAEYQARSLEFASRNVPPTQWHVPVVHFLIQYGGNGRVETRVRIVARRNGRRWKGRTTLLCSKQGVGPPLRQASTFSKPFTAIVSPHDFDVADMIKRQLDGNFVERAYVFRQCAERRSPAVD